MLIICFGMLKSGSTFAFQLVRDLLYANGHNQFQIKQRYLGADWRWQDGRGNESSHNLLDLSDGRIVTAVASAVPDDRILAVKSHSPPSAEVEELIRSSRASAIVSVRSPLACALALKRMAEMESGDTRVLRRFTDNLDFAAAFESANRCVEWANQWLQIPNTVRVDFQNLVRDPVPLVGLLMHKIGSAVEPCDVVQYYDNKRLIQEYTGPRTIAEKLEEIPQFTFSKLLNIGDNPWRNQGMEKMTHEVEQTKKSPPVQHQFPADYWFENLFHLSGVATWKGLWKKQKIDFGNWGIRKRRWLRLKQQAGHRGGYRAREQNWR